MQYKTKSIRKYFEKLVGLVVAQVFLITSLILPTPTYALTQKPDSQLAPPLFLGEQGNVRRGKINGGLVNPFHTKVLAEVEDAIKAEGIPLDTAKVLLQTQNIHKAEIPIKVNGEEWNIFVVRCQDNNWRGPFKGGIRFIFAGDDPLGRVLNERLEALSKPQHNQQEELQALAEDLERWVTQEGQAMSKDMTWKVALADLLYGGGKAQILGVLFKRDGEGRIVEVKPIRQKELSRDDRRNMMIAIGAEWAKQGIIGYSIDIPAPDVNTTAEDMAWILDGALEVRAKELELTPTAEDRRHPLNVPYLACAHRKEVREIGMITGKPNDLGGLPIRAIATGLGASYVISRALEEPEILSKMKNPDAPTLAINGFGNAGRYGALEEIKRGRKIVTINDTGGAVVKEEGFSEADINILIEAKENKQSVVDVAGKIEARAIRGKEEGDRAVLEVDVDILLLASVEDVIHTDPERPGYVGRVKARLLVEAANGPITREADQELFSKGKFVLPDILASAGGVIVSYWEWWLNDPANKRMTDDEIAEDVNTRMRTNFSQMWSLVKSEKISLRKAATRIAIRRVVATRQDTKHPQVLSKISDILLSAYQLVEDHFKGKAKGDEFVLPVVVIDETGKPIGRVKDGDTLFFVNFRTDRPRQLIWWFTGQDYEDRAGDVERGEVPDVKFITMTQYDGAFTLPAVLRTPPLTNTYGEVLAQNGIRQMRRAEDAKIKHVTYFLNGERTDRSAGEEWGLIPSQQVATYNSAPEMKATKLADAVIGDMRSSIEDIVLNFANADMLGHTGDFEAAKKGIEVVDEQLGRLIEEAKRQGYVVVITADHGNAEQMVDKSGKALTSHTSNPVPFIIIGLDGEVSLREGGNLTNIAPTLLHLRGIEKPKEMDHESLITSSLNTTYNKILTVVLDGWGIRKETEGNAIAQANTPNMDTFWRQYPHTSLKASEIPSSENGHREIGAGRRLMTARELINESIRDGSFFQNETLIQAMQEAKEKGATFHILGLLSDGNVHSSMEHWFATLELAKRLGLKGEQVVIHAFLDGRDTPPDSAKKYLDELQAKCDELGVGVIVDIMGRYWGMDRENKWDRTGLAVRALVNGEAAQYVQVSKATHQWQARPVWFFDDKTEASEEEPGKDLLGGKGAGVRDMTQAGLPVPPGYTITTEVCNTYLAQGVSDDELSGLNRESMAKLEQKTGKKFGDPKNPLLVSVRSGAKFSMPGMMDTVLNIGLNDNTVLGFAKLTNNPRLAWDAYRRLIQMFGKVVMDVDGDLFEKAIARKKEERSVKEDTELTAEDWQDLVNEFKQIIITQTGNEFPQNPYEQLFLATPAVFESWLGKRAKDYRRIMGIPEDLGTAVNVQMMVFGNMNANSGTGVAFTRDPATGEKKFYGDFLINAQGEDVVAGIRTPLSIAQMADVLPEVYKQLLEVAALLEKTYGDVQDIEFTIEDGHLWMLQTRRGQRTPQAALIIAMDMLDEGLIDEKEALMRVSPEQIEILLHDAFKLEAVKEAKEQGRLLTKGIDASPGAATGIAVLNAERLAKLKKRRSIFVVESTGEAIEEEKAIDMVKQGVVLKDTTSGATAKTEKEVMDIINRNFILMRPETNPNDVDGIKASIGVLTSVGGKTSHAAVVTRGFGIPAIVGTRVIEIDEEKGEFKVGDKIFKEGDFISIDGATGEVFEGRLETVPSPIIQNALAEDQERARKESPLYAAYIRLMRIADKYARLGAWANADNKEDAEKARRLGAVGIGLARTEHMFMGKRLPAVQRMLFGALTANEEIRDEAIEEILPLQRQDFKDLFKAMDGLPVTIRLLDPPLHEFLSRLDDEGIRELAKKLGKTEEQIRQILKDISEENPMFGYRGVRLLLHFPEIARMQVRAIIEAAIESQNEGVAVKPEIMVPVVSDPEEYRRMHALIREVADEVLAKKDVKLKNEYENGYKIGTMIEITRITLLADRLIEMGAEFFSFGTNDLTQSTFSLSRDDVGFIPGGVERGIYLADPFQVVDNSSVGVLIALTRLLDYKGIKIGICGEHGGDPTTIKLLHNAGLTYASASPFRVPITRLAAAQAKIREERDETNEGVQEAIATAKRLKDEVIPAVREGKSLVSPRPVSARISVNSKDEVSSAITSGNKSVNLDLTQIILKNPEVLLGLRRTILLGMAKDNTKVFDEELKNFSKALEKAILEIVGKVGLENISINLLDISLFSLLSIPEEEIEGLSVSLGISKEELAGRIKLFKKEANPAFAERGTRFFVGRGEKIFRAQLSGIFEAVKKFSGNPVLQINIPFLSETKEVIILREIANSVVKEYNTPYKLGAIIETPKAAMIAGKLVETGLVDALVIDLLDLTQGTWGMTRKDAEDFLKAYLEQGIITTNPFEKIDQNGILVLIAYAVQQARNVNPEIPIEVAGPQLADKASSDVLAKMGIDGFIAEPAFTTPTEVDALAFSDMVKAGKQWLKTLIPDKGFIMPDGTEVTRITDISQLPESVKKYWDNHVGIVVMRNDRLNYTAYLGLHHMLPFKKTFKGLGGTRNLSYASTEDALIDALILPRAMSDKAVYLGAKGIPLGGGKLVINSNPNVSIDERKEVYASVGAALEKLNIILTGQDMNTTLELALHMSQSAPNSLIGHSSMPLGGKETTPWTAEGIFSGWKGMIRANEGEKATLQGRNISILGVGGVGSNLVRLVVENEILAPDGKNVLYVTDSRKEALDHVRNTYGKLVEAGRIVIFDNPDDIFNAPAEIFSPNATRYDLNSRTIPKLIDAGVKYIAGAENEQLETPEDAERLHEAGIIYVVDYVINAGGMAAAVSTALDLDMAEVVKGIGESVYQLIKQAKEQGVSSVKIADVEAARRLKAFDVQLLENAKMLLAQVKPVTPAARRSTGTGTPARGLREIKKFLSADTSRTTFTVANLNEEASASTVRRELDVLLEAGLIRQFSSAHGNKAATYMFDERVRVLTDEQFEEIANIQLLNQPSLTKEDVSELTSRVNEKLAALVDFSLNLDYAKLLAETTARISEKVIVLQPHMIGEALFFKRSLERLIQTVKDKIQIVIDGSKIEDLEGFMQATGLTIKGEGYSIITDATDIESLKQKALAQVESDDDGDVVVVGTKTYLEGWFSYPDIKKLMVDTRVTQDTANIGILPAAVGVVRGWILEDIVTRGEGNAYILSPTKVSAVYSEQLAGYKAQLGAK